MKISKNDLLSLIKEEIAQRQPTILLETPGHSIIGQEQDTGDYRKDPDGYEGQMSKRSLYHMARQADQLHDVLMDDENLEPWVQDKISKAAEYIEKAFKAIMYDKDNPEGR